MKGASRFERSLAALASNTLLPDGRRPVYFAFLDLKSRPFWEPSDCDPGVPELLNDLRRNREALLNEVKLVRHQTNEKQLGNNWSVLTVFGDGKEASDADASFPVLMSLLRRHKCVSFRCPFQGLCFVC
jgi:hypothetical protein